MPGSILTERVVREEGEIMPMTGKVVVVTGTATGIGRAIAERLAAEGALVLCADVDEERNRETVEGIERSGDRAEAHVCDVADPEAVERLMTVAEARGGPHALVANAGIQYERTIEDTPPEDWDRVLGVDLKGVYL